MAQIGELFETQYSQFPVCRPSSRNDVRPASMVQRLYVNGPHFSQLANGRRLIRPISARSNSPARGVDGATFESILNAAGKSLPWPAKHSCRSRSELAHKIERKKE